MGSLRVGHDWATSLSLFTFMHWRRKWQATPVFLPGESQGWGSLVGCSLGVAQSRTRLKWLSSSSSSSIYYFNLITYSEYLCHHICFHAIFLIPTCLFNTDEHICFFQCFVFTDFVTVTFYVYLSSSILYDKFLEVGFLGHRFSSLYHHHWCIKKIFAAIRGKVAMSGEC